MSTDFSLGLSRRMKDGQDFISRPAWNRAIEGQEVIGSCRRQGCGGLMKALKVPKEEGRIEWLEAECMNCGALVAAPDGRTLARSSRREEMPSGWWDQRMNLLTKLAAMGKEEGA